MNEELLREIKKSIDELNENLKLTNREVFNAREAADYLRIGYDTILRLTRINEIKAVRNGSSYIYKKEFLNEWLDKSTKIG